MLVNPLLPLLIGLAFLYLFANENSKPERQQDILFMWLWFFVALTFFSLSFFQNVEVSSSISIPNINSTTTTVYSYAPDTLLENVGFIFGIISLTILVMIAFRLLYTRFKEVI